jgi:hypothetical protein
MTSATDLAQLNSDVARLVFGIQRCDKPMLAMKSEFGPCSLDGDLGHLAADEPAHDYVGDDTDDSLGFGQWDGMREIIRAMDAKGWTCSICYGSAKGNPPEAEFWPTGSGFSVVGERSKAPTLPEAVARAAVAALRAAGATAAR